MAAAAGKGSPGGAGCAIIAGSPGAGRAAPTPGRGGVRDGGLGASVAVADPQGGLARGRGGRDRRAAGLHDDRPRAGARLLAATVQRLIHETRPVHVVCAGTEGRVSYEDSLLAGALASRFVDLEHALGNDEAEIVRAMWERVQEVVWSHEDHGGRPGEEPPLVRYLKRGAGGRRVMELGLGDDVAAAAAINRPDCQVVVELARDPLRLVVSD